MLSHLPADQRAARLAAAVDHPRHQVLDLIRLELADGDVVEEEQRLGALGGDVVHAHRHQVDADGGEAARGLGDEGLGAHPVGGGHEHRIAVAALVEGEQPAEPADVAHHLGPEGRAHPVLDTGDGLVAGADAYARSLVCLTHGFFEGGQAPPRPPPRGLACARRSPAADERGFAAGSGRRKHHPRAGASLVASG